MPASIRAWRGEEMWGVGGELAGGAPRAVLPSPSTWYRRLTTVEPLLLVSKFNVVVRVCLLFTYLPLLLFFLLFTQLEHCFFWDGQPRLEFFMNNRARYRDGGCEGAISSIVTHMCDFSTGQVAYACLPSLLIRALPPGAYRTDSGSVDF